MNSFSLTRQTARLIILQRIELLGPVSKKIRKILGRYLFTNFITKYFFNPKKIGDEYFKIMQSEFLNLSKYIDFTQKKILTIGSGIGGFEAIVIIILQIIITHSLKKIMFQKKLNTDGTLKMKSHIII